MPEHALERSRALRDFGRAAGGALIFSLPMLMTLELWEFGGFLERVRLLALVLTALPLLVLLARQIGFASSSTWRDSLLDALIALGVAGVIAVVLLVLFGVIDAATPRGEAAGLITLQMIPGAIGALLARSEFGADPRDEDDPGEESYEGELFLMGVGALFLGFSIAPTDEVMLIAFRMAPWQVLGLVLLSLALMHGFVFAVGFAGGSTLGPDHRTGSAFIRFTLPGYVIALAISVFLLWAFARTEGVDPGTIAVAAVVLAFPSAIGAAAARLVL